MFSIARITYVSFRKSSVLLCLYHFVRRSFSLNFNFIHALSRIKFNIYKLYNFHLHIIFIKKYFFSFQLKPTDRISAEGAMLHKYFEELPKTLHALLPNG